MPVTVTRTVLSTEERMTGVPFPIVLLRPATERYGSPAPAAPRSPAGHTAAGQSRILVTLYYRDRPFDDSFAELFEREARPALAKTGAAPLACLTTEYAENTFPALPV